MTEFAIKRCLDMLPEALFYVTKKSIHYGEAHSLKNILKKWRKANGNDNNFGYVIA